MIHWSLIHDISYDNLHMSLKCQQIVLPHNLCWIIPILISWNLSFMHISHYKNHYASQSKCTVWSEQDFKIVKSTTYPVCVRDGRIMKNTKKLLNFPLTLHHHSHSASGILQLLELDCPLISQWNPILQISGYHSSQVRLHFTPDAKN